MTLKSCITKNLVYGLLNRGTCSFCVCLRVCLFLRVHFVKKKKRVRFVLVVNVAIAQTVVAFNHV